jgi:hypothetical protein
VFFVTSPLGWFYCVCNFPSLAKLHIESAFLLDSICDMLFTIKKLIRLAKGSNLN